jgi:glycerate 2-kinase
VIHDEEPSTVNSKSTHKLVKEIFYAALRAVDPHEAVRLRLPDVLLAYRNGGYERLLLASFGKAAYRMTKAVTDSLPGLVTEGIVITKYGHSEEASLSRDVDIYEAGHPVPDGNGFAATKRAVDMLARADRETLVLCLISGGGSALLVAPCEGITLDEKQQITERLLRVGANIDELNRVRKHISGVKGGKLAEIAYPAKVVSLILSDVIGDSLDVIASGPTSPDSSTYVDALNVVEKYGLTERISVNALALLQDGAAGKVPETPKMGDPLFEGVENIIVGSNRTATEAATKKARELGFDVTILSSELQGEAREAGQWLAEKAISTRYGLRVAGSGRACVISGGETTVTVKGSGKGGRNTELALAFAMAIEGMEGITLLSAGTDGTDGPTDAAGAIVDGNTVNAAKARGFDPQAYLQNNDSYTFFEGMGGLFITGPTGTNVMDLQIILVEGEGCRV